MGARRLDVGHEGVVPDAGPDGGLDAGRTGGLLAVHAHPDDETLSTGALLATWAMAGRPVTVVTCTRGERGEVIGPELAHLAADPMALAAHREGELAAALAALGVSDHVFLDRIPPTDPVGRVPGRDPDARFEDSGMVWVRPGQAGADGDVPPGAFVGVPVADAAARLATVIRARRPDVVVGYEPGGGYGHPDHVHAHRVMRAAVEAAAVPGPTAHRVPVVLWAAVDVAALSAARRELAHRELGGRLQPGGFHPEPPDAPGPSAGVPAGDVAVRVDVSAVLDRVAGALAAHRTQVQGVLTWHDEVATAGCFALSNGVLYPILRAEAYTQDPGWPPAPVTWPVGISGGIA